MSRGLETAHPPDIEYHVSCLPTVPTSIEGVELEVEG